MRPRFLIKGLKLWRFDNTVSEFWAYFTAHAQKQQFRNFLSNIWPRLSLRRPRFPKRHMHFHYRVTFTGYIRCFCATTSLDLLTLRVFHVQCFSCPTSIPIFIILRLSVTELRVLNIWSHFRYLKQSLSMRRVTWPVYRRSPKTTRTIFWPRLVYSLYNFYAATITIKGSLYWSIPMLKRFSAAKSPQNRSPKWRFFRNLRVQI